jgi:hypothetical protein
MPVKQLTDEDCIKIGKILNHATNRCNKVKPAKPVKSVEPVKSVKSAKPVKPVKSVEPSKKLSEEDCLKIGKILNHATNRCNKVKTAKPAKPAKKIAEAKPVKPAKPAKPSKKLTEEDCFKIGKVLNPKTNRCNKTKFANARYSPIKSPSISIKSRSPMMSSSRKRKVDAFVQNRAARIIQRFAKPLANKGSNIENRIKNYQSYHKYLSKFDVNQCLKITSMNEENVTYSLANDEIKLEKNINEYAQLEIEARVYKSRGSNEGALFNFSSKIFEQNEGGEVRLKIHKDTTNLVLKKITPHFPIMYYNFTCNFPDKYGKLPNFFIDKFDYEYNYENPFQRNEKKYHIILTELAEGNLSSWLYKNYKNSAKYHNALAQTYICILTLHAMGYSHNSIVGGIFLYYKITPGGYFEYVINGLKVYIKNIGFLWVLQSFNYVKELEDKRWFKDYDDLFTEFQQRNEYGDKPRLVNNMIDIMNNLRKEPLQRDSQFFEALVKQSKLFITKLPKDAVIVNKGSPYIIKI